MSTTTTSFLDLIQAIPFSYAALFPVLNPLGSAVIFLTLTEGVSQRALNVLALKVAMNTFIMLVVVLITGAWILRFFGINIPMVQIGGGLVVAYIGWSLLNKETIEEDSRADLPRRKKDITGMAFYPLTMPITAGPGCIAVTLTIGAHETRHALGSDFYTQVFTQIGAVMGIALASATVYICYRYANNLTRRLGETGNQVIMRLSAFINLCIGLTIIWHGVQGLMGQ